MRYFTILNLLLLNGLLNSQNPSGASGNNFISIIYDFDGLNIGQTDLPDGDYKNNDLVYSVAANPLAPSEVIGDRVLKLNFNWTSGSGEFGKTANRVIQLDRNNDRINFYFYNPPSSSGTASVQVLIQEDDNESAAFETASDDKWTCNTSILQSGAWQLVSLPLTSFIDANGGGNGQFDARYNSPGGMIFNISLTFYKPTAGAVSDEYYLDLFCFTDGEMPRGNSILELPGKDPYSFCKLGALTGNAQRDQVPAEVQAYLPPGKKITFVNWFLYYSNGTGPANLYPGPEVQSLIDNGYQPIITWESMYGSYSRLDANQPRLDKVLDGTFDAYYDAFAGKIKAVNGKVIIRIFHEMEGDWYPWSLSENGKDPAKYIAAYRHVVDRFRAAGANNVQWMWCLNAEPKPYRTFNNIMSCYPGDPYVDMVATDIYNHPNLGTPDWKSFRYTIAESYYLLTKFIPQKPIYICEVACRERDASEPAGSQKKGEWLCQMNRDLQTYFFKTSALVFFSVIKEHDWRINSSDAAKQSFVDCFWNDGFYYGPTAVEDKDNLLSFTVYPNPFDQNLKLLVEGVQLPGTNNEIMISDLSGRIVYHWKGEHLPAGIIDSNDLPAGVYIISVKNQFTTRTRKVVKLRQD